MKTKILSIIVIFNMFLFSCNKEIQFEEVSSEEVATFNDSTSSTFGTNLLNKGVAWKAWNEYFKDCIQSSTFQKAQFAGYSNSIQLGDIRTNKGLAAYSLYDFIDESYIKDLQKPIGSIGNTCSKQKDKKKNLMTEIGLSFIDVANPTLRAALKWKDSISLNTVDFVSYELNMSKFTKAINEDSNLIDYKKEAEKKGNRVVAQVLKCKSASFIVYLNTEIKDSLAINLTKGVLEKLKISDSNISANFKAINNKTIQGEINEEFTLFVNMVKSK